MNMDSRGHVIPHDDPGGRVTAPHISHQGPRSRKWQGQRDSVVSTLDSTVP